MPLDNGNRYINEPVERVVDVTKDVSVTVTPTPAPALAREPKVVHYEGHRIEHRVEQGYGI